MTRQALIVLMRWASKVPLQTQSEFADYYSKRVKAGETIDQMRLDNLIEHFEKTR